MNNQNRSKKLRVALIANTGIGNEVFKALLKCSSVTVDSVLTRKLEGEFPYFKTQELHQLVTVKGIKCFTNIDANTAYYEYLCMQNIDLILVATYHQIIKKTLIELPKLGFINYHPSLLPKYRGPSPISWVILNGESETGITIHNLTTKVDEGSVLSQDSINIECNDNLGSLFQKLSILSGKMTPVIIEQLLNQSILPKEQNNDESSYFSRPINKNIIYESMDFNSIYRIVKAFHPFPKAVFMKGRISYKVNNYSFKYNDIKISNPENEEILSINNNPPLYLHLIRS